MESSNIKKAVGETCVICEETKERGIHLYNQFICCDCETEIVATETNDEKYNYYLNQMRKLSQPIVDIK
ncbi:sigma factor G inhibitor Gin [Bacillus sp. Marseille-P3661]|uniref:sigma factor G inhibitor Gin n=1 Tax=Bacillus sp. Marseille-P3661 TaxID=1936234 RepID=UPI000C823E99|nr:sigma factor G inhibitor Gin [Bacillus sp. Marseille-P3661]